MTLAVLALLALVAAIGFGLRYRRSGRISTAGSTIAATLTLFAELHYVLTPALSGEYVLHGDFLRVLAYGDAARRRLARDPGGGVRPRGRGGTSAGRARDPRRPRAVPVRDLDAREHARGGAPLDEVLPKLTQAAAQAQQEARFAVLALSSASGTAPFDAALRRYVEFLTADGELDVDVEIEPQVAPRAR